MSKALLKQLGLSKDAQEEVLANFKLVMDKYGKKLDSGERQEVLMQLAAQQAMAEVLKEFEERQK